MAKNLLLGLSVAAAERDRTQPLDGNPLQVLVYIHGEPVGFSKAELQEMLDNPKMYEQADNLPVWVQRSLLGTEEVPKVPRERGGEYSNKAFDRAYQLTLQKIQQWMNSPKPVTVRIDERFPKDKNKHPWQQMPNEHDWTRTMKVEGAVAEPDVPETDVPVWVYDAGEEDAPLDRYTIIFTETGHEGTMGGWVYDALAAGPGVNQHVEAKAGDHLGKKISVYALPEHIQEQVFRELDEMGGDVAPSERGDPSEPPGLEASDKEGAAGAAPALDPGAAPKPFVPRKPTEAEMQHEMKRFNDAADKPGQIETYLERRLNSIRDPQKLFAFALLLENENFHTFNRKVFDKLKALGWNGQFPKGASVKQASGQHNWVIEGNKTVCSYCGTPWDKDSMSSACSKRASKGCSPAQEECNICHKCIPRDDMYSHKLDSHNVHSHSSSQKTADGVNNEVAMAGAAISPNTITMDSSAPAPTAPIEHKGAAARPGEFDNDPRPGIYHHTFVPHPNQAENSKCKVCGKAFDAVDHTNTPVRAASLQTLASFNLEAAYPFGAPVDEDEVVAHWEGCEFIAVPRGGDPNDPKTPKVMFVDEWDPASDHTPEQLAKIFTPKGRYDFYSEVNGGGFNFAGQGTLAHGAKFVEKYEQKFLERQEQQAKEIQQEEDLGEVESSDKTADKMDIENPEYALLDPNSKLRPFSKHDWYGYAGAERFAKGWKGNRGGEPLIAEIPVTNWPELDEFGDDPTKPMDTVTLIVDANGVALHGINGAYGKNLGSDQANIKAAEQLATSGPIDAAQLESQGWENQNLPDQGEAAATLDARNKSYENEGEVGPHVPSGSDAAYRHTLGSDEKTAAPGDMSEGVDPALVDEINQQTEQDEMIDADEARLEEEGRQDRELHEQAQADKQPVRGIQEAMEVLGQAATTDRVRSAVAYVQRVVDSYNNRLSQGV